MLTTIVLDAQRNVVGINQGVASGRKLREQFENALGTRQAPINTVSPGEKEWQSG